MTVMMYPKKENKAHKDDHRWDYPNIKIISESENDIFLYPISYKENIIVVAKAMIDDDVRIQL